MALCYVKALMIFMSYAAALALSRESCAAATFITSYDCVPGAWEGCTVKFDSTLPGVPCTAGNPCAAPAPVPANPMPAPPISLGSPIRSGTLTGANVFYLQACSDARFEITFAADPTGTRGPIQGYYGPMFEGETAGGGTVISVSNEQAVVATELGTIRCDGADASKNAQFIMVYCGADTCSNCVLRTTAASTPWHCDPAQPITGNANPHSNPRRAMLGAGGSSFGLAAPGMELAVAQELKCEKVECQGEWYRLNDSLNGLTVFCGDFETCLGTGGVKLSLGQRVDGDWDQHVCVAAERLWAGQGCGHSHSFGNEAKPTKNRDDSDTATANLSLDPLCGVQLSEQIEKLNQDSKAEMNALAQEYKQELNLQCEAMVVKWNAKIQDLNKNIVSTKQELNIAQKLGIRQGHRGRPQEFGGEDCGIRDGDLCCLHLFISSSSRTLSGIFQKFHTRPCTDICQRFYSLKLRSLVWASAYSNHECHKHSANSDATQMDPLKANAELIAANNILSVIVT